MSFILDALKKSEMERQRQALPGLMEASVARKPRGFPAWALALAALLAVNLVVLAVVLTRGGTHGAPSIAIRPGGDEPAISAVPVAPAPASRAPAAPDSAPQGASPTVPQTAAAERAAAPHFSPMDAPPVYAPEIPVGNTPGTSSLSQPVPSIAHPMRPHVVEAPAETEEPLPAIGEVNLDPPLPEMHLDIHVYAAKPADRFVYINSRKYAEGATLAEGPVLERIRRDGAVLDYRGSRFLLPRQ